MRLKESWVARDHRLRCSYQRVSTPPVSIAKNARFQISATSMTLLMLRGLRQNIRCLEQIKLKELSICSTLPLIRWKTFNSRVQSTKMTCCWSYQITIGQLNSDIDFWLSKVPTRPFKVNTRDTSGSHHIVPMSETWNKTSFGTWSNRERLSIWLFRSILTWKTRNQL